MSAAARVAPVSCECGHTAGPERTRQGVVVKRTSQAMAVLQWRKCSEPCASPAGRASRSASAGASAMGAGWGCCAGLLCPIGHNKYLFCLI